MTGAPAARVPLVTGIGPRVGTSTLAAALHAEDGGVLGQQADVVVCGSAAESLRDAAAVICPGRGPRPVLAVVGPRVVPLPPALRSRFSAIVEVPHVHRWDGAGPPVEEADEVLAVSPDLLDPPLRRYSAALRAVVAALVGSGQLSGSTPPMVIRPRRAEPWRGLRPSMPPADPGPAPGRHRRPAEIRIVDHPSTRARPAVRYAELDDAAIEAGTLAADRRAGGPGRLAG